MKMYPILLCFCALLAGAAWPTFRGDSGRSGYTSQPLSPELTPQWQHRPRQRPTPAWPTHDNLDFDRGPALVVAADTVFVGSSATGTLQALDAKTGSEQWRYHSAGPLRLAPAYADGRLFLAGDDGWLRCLAAADGRVIWERALAPSRDMLLGNGRMISRWPARSGPVVQDGRVYVGAGVWPSEGFYLHCFDAATGEPIWSNTETGSKRMPQPHGDTDAASGVAGQGYLAIAGEHLYVPTGRAVPAAFVLETGAYRYFHLQRYGSRPHYLGGSDIVALSGAFFNSGAAFAHDTGLALGTIGTRHLAGHQDGLLTVADETLSRYTWGPVSTKDGRGQPITRQGTVADWSTPLPGATGPIIATPTHAVVAADSAILVVDLADRKTVRRLTLAAPVFDLAIADGQLFASDTAGNIHAFGPARGAADTSVFAAPGGLLATKLDEADALVTAANRRRGWAIDFACGDGQLSCALALRSELAILAIAADAESATAVRDLAASLGLLGTRVSVIQRADEGPPFIRDFASLLFASEQVTAGSPPLFLDIAAEFARPGTGVSLWRDDVGLQARVRPPKTETGSWTHQYATPGNTVCSGETALSGTLRMQWFGDLPAVLPQRGFAPLVADGDMVVAAFDQVMCSDAYTGRVRWQRPFPGLIDAYKGSHWASAITTTRICMDAKAVYVHDDRVCHKLARDTGAILHSWPPPYRDDEAKDPWGFMSVIDGVLVGGIAIPSHTSERVFPAADMKKVLSESRALFALDTATGQPRWRIDAQHAFRHNAIAGGNGRLFFIDRPLAVHDTGRAVPWKHPDGELVCVDLKTGEERWRVREYVYGTSLAYDTGSETLVMSYHKWRWSPNSERGGRISAFDAKTGTPKWKAEGDYRTRLVIVDDRIYSDGGAWDLATGESLPFPLQRSYGCGQISASASQLYFRSATLGYIDLDQPEKIMNLGGMRPSCWINAVPACGLLLVPESTPRCRCSYLNKTWFALAPQ